MYLKETKGVIGKGLKGEKGKGNVIKIKVIKKKKQSSLLHYSSQPTPCLYCLCSVLLF